MSSDYTNSKKATTSVYPDRAIDATDWKRHEPLITPQQLRDRFCFGIPLVSSVVDPITRRPQVMSNDLLKDQIVRAVGQAEIDLGIDIFPVKRDEPYPFDRNTFQMWGHVKVQHSPILSIDSISIKPGTENSLYNVPLDWISTANFNKGQINIIPLLPANKMNYSLSPAGAGAGAVFLQMISGVGWIPVFWSIQYTSGFPDGSLPVMLNELIGCYASIEVLSLLATTNKSSSHSLGMDGMNQSVSTPGPQVYDGRINLLTKKAEKLVGKIRALYGKKFHMSNI